MKKIVEYMMHGKDTPYFIVDGGYYWNNEKMVGVTKDDSQCFVPTTTKDGGELVEFITRYDLKIYLDTLNLKDIDGNLINTESEADRFFTEKGL